MINLNPIVSKQASPELLGDLDRRDVALWIILQGESDAIETSTLTSFAHLPWRLVVVETASKQLISAMTKTASNDPLVRIRGFPQIISENPTHLDLPQRCLPIYLLDGLPGRPHDQFQDQLRRITMLNELRRSEARRILILGASTTGDFPAELHQICTAEFRPTISLCGHEADTKMKSAEYENLNLPLTIFDIPPPIFVNQILTNYKQNYSQDHTIIRMRKNVQGELVPLDITEIDDPERPILSDFSVIREADLANLLPTDLSKEELVGFFRDPTASWLPYAAAIPWARSEDAQVSLLKILQKIELQGAAEGVITKVIAESGSGGTTLVRQLAWHCACDGYPVLVARQSPFSPDSLKVSNFLNRIHRLANPTEDDSSYEAPWVIVFDRVHWEHGDLHSFLRDMRRDGRPVCLLVVAGPRRGLSTLHAHPEVELATLTHMIRQESASDLGKHLNKFLDKHGMGKPIIEWKNFHRKHSVGNMAHFWIALSFWIQGYHDLSETIQERIFRSFSDDTDSVPVKQAILDIAALSAEGIPIPESALSTPKTLEWPVSQLLEDALPDLAYMGLLPFKIDENRYWAIAHDILAQQLLSAVFSNFDMRKTLELESADETAHMRLLILRRISKRLETGRQSLRNLGEQFALTVLKIDPDHGHAAFSRYWREAMASLDEMPDSLRNASRLFRHHTAISRRRIAKLEGPFYDVSDHDRENLLKRAIGDVKYAIEAIPFELGTEPDLNLYNTLALAYFDLAELLAQREAEGARVVELRAKGNEAARRVFDEDPSNSFAIETYVRNLFSRADLDLGSAVKYVIEALGILFSALVSNERAYRVAHLENLAQKAVNFLFRSGAGETRFSDNPTDSLGVLQNAWVILTKDSFLGEERAFEEIPSQRLVAALRALAHPAGEGNVQVRRLRYEITCIAYPNDTLKQMELVQGLQEPGVSPQLRLEYAILLYQTSRPVEGNDEFYRLRQLWRERDYVVEVPERLRWLRDEEGRVRTVQAVVATSDSGRRPMAFVNEFRSKKAPFRPEEFGERVARPGWRFACAVTFGNNGPLLRPTNAAPRKVLVSRSRSL